MSLSRHFLRAPRLLSQCQRLAVASQQRCNASEGVKTEMAFTFASPSDVYYQSSEVRQVDVPSLSGSFGVLVNHVPTIAALMPVSSGAITVNSDSTVQLLAEEAHPLDRFDVQTVSSNLNKANSEVLAARSEEEKAEAQIMVDCLTTLQNALR
ncbi:ATPD-like protein [Mya arenaria]|uniref:ATPD-like protein n=1 Tax=Mya arenaria TaxID=6604 RepID=A0ABY7FQJ3_MYAAR|nr:ATPD-like protein [Mya arenaria]